MMAELVKAVVMVCQGYDDRNLSNRCPSRIALPHHTHP